jgi:hypothetical protein
MFQSRLLRFSVVVLAVVAGLANSSNPSNGRTGAPFDGHCNGCHGGNNPNNYAGTVDISIAGSPSTLTPGTTYPITLTMTTTGSSSAVRGGFQLVVVDANNADCGDLTISTTDVGTETGTANREYVEHRGAKNFSGVGSSISWSFNWVAPATVPGNTVKFYFIGNFCNGSGSSGDYMVTALEQVPFSAPISTVEVSLSSNNVVCFGQNNGNITASASGGTTPYTYLWSNNQTTATANNLAPGTYTVTVTGAAGSGTATASAVIAQPANLTVTTSVSNALNCTNTESTITATPAGGTVPYTYAWPGGGNSNAITVQQAGAYVVTVTDANGCTRTASATVQQNIIPPVAQAFSGGIITCINSSVTVSGQGSSSGPNFTYLWTASNGGIINGPTTNLTASAGAAGTYTLQVTNTSNGCTSTASVNVVANIVPPNVGTQGATLTCANPIGTICANSPTPGATYAWSTPTGILTTPCITVSIPGIYVVTVTVPNGCTSTASATVNQDAVPPAVAVAANPAVLSCAQLTTTLVATTNGPNNTCIWSGPGIVSGNNSFTATANQLGVYTATITNPTNGCTASASVSVTQDVTLPVAVIAPPPTLTPSNPTATLDGTASSQGATFSYAWSSNNGGNIVSGVNTLTPTVNAPGSYCLTVTNVSNGCTASACVNVAQDVGIPLSVSVTGSNVSCFGGQNGTATAFATGGNGVYAYAWSNGGTTAQITNLAVGTYTVTVTDGLNNTATASITLSQPSSSVQVSVLATNETSSGGANGTATATPTGGTPGYSFVWNTGATTSAINALAPATYTVTVTDANGCTAQQSAVVSAFVCTLAGTLNTSQITCAGQNNGSIGVNLTNATSPLVYQWSTGGSVVPQIGNLPPGTYTVTVSDATNCSVVLTTTITEPAPLVASANATPQSSVGVNDGTAQVSASGGTGAYAYIWSNAATTASIGGLAPGTYTATVTDANGCTTSASATVNAANCNLNVSATATNVACFGQNSAVITATAVGNAAPFQYLWYNGSSATTIGNLPAGVYTVTVTDAQGCVATTFATVTQPEVLVFQIETIINVVCAGDTNGSATWSVLGGTQPYQVTWPGAGGGTMPNLGVGIYTFTVTDANGCTATDDAVIVAVDTVPPTIACPDNLIECDYGLPVEYVLPTAQDNCGLNTSAVTQIAGDPSGSFFFEGVNTQVFQVADNQGNTATCSFTITIHPVPDVALVSAVNDTNGSGTGSIDVTPIGGTQPYLFVWEKDGQEYATSEDLTGLSQGVYLLTMIDANGCAVTLSAITIDNVVGTDALAYDTEVSVVPNPAHDIFSLKIKNVEAAQVAVVDRWGRTLHVVRGQDCTRPIRIDGLPTGVYLVRMTTPEGVEYWTRLIKAD